MRPFLRAYMAGITLPTMIVPLVVAALAMQHSAQRGFHLADVLIFPVGLAPNAWGLWNVLYVSDSALPRDSRRSVRRGAGRCAGAGGVRRSTRAWRDAVDPGAFRRRVPAHRDVACLPLPGNTSSPA